MKKCQWCLKTLPEEKGYCSLDCEYKDKLFQVLRKERMLHHLKS